VSTYVYLLRPVWAGLARAPSQDEERVLEAHFDRLKEALADRRLILAGPCLDGAFGIVVFRASSEMEAAAFMEGDPAVREGLMTATLHPFRVSLFEGEDGAAAGTQARPRV
jgi:uncharacterized protein YciI